MDKQEPRIIAVGFSNEELFQWMRGKVSAARQLEAALADKQSIKQALGSIEHRISELTSSAALEVSDIDQDPTHLL